MIVIEIKNATEFHFILDKLKIREISDKEPLYIWKGYSVLKLMLFLFCNWRVRVKIQDTLRWDTGDEKISSLAWRGAYAHRSSLDKYFSKISHKQNKS